MKKKINNYKSLTNILDIATKKLYKTQGFHIFKLMDQWRDIIDNQYFDQTFPRIIKKYRGTATLEIEVYNSAILFDLQYGKDQIISDINNYFQSEIIHDIKFKIRPEENDNKNIFTKELEKKDITPKTKKLLNKVEDKEMKLILEDIATKI